MGRGELPAEGLVDAVLQLAAFIRRLLGLAAGAVGIPALEPAEPRAAARRSERKSRWTRNDLAVLSKCFRIKHVDVGDAMWMDGRVLGQLDRPHSVGVVQQIHE